MGSTLKKEYNYPKHNTTIYLYDTGSVKPSTYIKIRKSFLPLMNNVKLLENCLVYEINELQKNDIVQLSTHKDTIEISLKTGKLLIK